MMITNEKAYSLIIVLHTHLWRLGGWSWRPSCQRQLSW